MVRADAAENYRHLLDVARVVVAEQGAEASLRDIARRAGVVVGTLYRHFPTREALLEALLHDGFGELTEQAAALEASSTPRDALVTWVRDCVAFTRTYRGVTTVMMTAIEDPGSALHTSCVALRAAGTGLLERAQTDGVARTDIDGLELFDLIAALAWLGDQPGTAPRAGHVFDLVVDGLLESGPRRPSRV